MKRKKPITVNIDSKPIEKILTAEEQAFENLDSGAKNAYKRWQQASGNFKGTVADWRAACVEHRLQRQKAKAGTDSTTPYVLMNGVQGLQLLSNNNVS